MGTLCLNALLLLINFFVILLIYRQFALFVISVSQQLSCITASGCENPKSKKYNNVIEVKELNKRNYGNLKLLRNPYLPQQRSSVITHVTELPCYIVKTIYGNVP